MDVATFNRTSLELKRLMVKLWRSYALSFNRTSLELKPFHAYRHIRFTAMTFNRTSLELKHDAATSLWNRRGDLLIAPVWNWNMDTRCIWLLPKLSLLIAPVWNWNIDSVTFTGMEDLPFNRTSLELKLKRKFPTGQEIPPAFNRTSLELKRFCKHFWRAGVVRGF